MNSIGQDKFPLPPELLAQMLQQLEQSDILGSCSLVSQSWRAAATSAAGAKGIGIALKPVCRPSQRFIRRTGYTDMQRQKANSRADGVCSWLAKYGRQVTGLTWWYLQPSWEKLCLPYSELRQLQDLCLFHTHLVNRPETPPAPNASSAAMLTGAVGGAACCCTPTCPLKALTNLTQLFTFDSRVCSGGLCCLSSLKRLQQLKLCGIDPAIFNAALPGMAQLAHLTCLQLLVGCGAASGGETLELGSLQHLRDLSVSFGPAVRSRQLPHGLTSLVVLLSKGGTSIDSLVISSSSTPGISSLTALQELELVGVTAVDVAVLAGMGQLSSIVLKVAQFGVQSLAALLAIVPRLQQLERLQVERCGVPHGARLPPPELSAAVAWQQQPAACNLQHLTRVVFADMSWPAGVGRHIFAADWWFPVMREFQLAYNTHGYLHGNHDSLLQFPEAASAPLDADGLARLANCCPALEHLDVSGALQPGVNVSCLAQLKCLTQLAVAGEAVDDRTGRELAQLTQLEVLRIKCVPQFSDAGLLCLTALTRLWDLHIREANFSKELQAYEFGCLTLGCERSTTDVWQQLERHCRDSSVCRELMLLGNKDSQTAEQAPDRT